MIRWLPLLAVAGCGLTADAPAQPEPAPPPVHEKTVYSDVYDIDGKYRSMRGPWSQQHVYLVESAAPELLWITGYETRVIDAESTDEVGQEFMCHANLDFDAEQYFDDFDLDHSLSGRVFTLSQGQQHIEFPTGFGVPILSTQPLKLTTQVLNLNLDDPDMDVRHEVTIEFVRDSEVEGEMTPMFQAAVQGFKSLEGEGLVYGIDDPEMAEHGGGCAVGQSAIDNDVDYDGLGRKFTAHWVVPPGREVTRTNVTEFLNLEFDTTVHYIAVHLHPFAESLELIDLTTGETVYRAEVENSQGKIGLERVPYYTSTEGKKLYADHQYELVSVYDNTSGEPQDSMAVMYLYLADPTWKKPDLAALATEQADQQTPVDEPVGDGEPPSM